ncbi:MAG: hypothetical protein KDE53_30905, partial [Caldilineaceae bacterium]|nr:hypothetical protein [Caldilineaceae bacterium]
ARPIAAIGADLLPAPNLLAEGQTDTTGLPVYDLGMVWARALWDVRTLLDNHSAEVAWGPLRGADLADRLALDAYFYAHGWVANFEQAAEGLIDSARQKALPAEIIDTLIDLFADRLILADQGIQALVAYTDPADGLCLLAGSDAGLRRSHDQGANWQEWGQLAAGERLTGVVALQRNHSGDLLFAATEQGIYRRAVTDTKWSGVGTPPLPLLPLSMTVVGDQPFVGTGDGVWHLSADQWQRWGDLAGVAWQLADMVCQAGAGTIVTNRYATLIAGVRHRRVGNAAQLWTSSGSIPGALVTAVAGHDNRIYAGTLRDGIWRQDGTSCTQNAGITLSSWTQIVTPVQLAFAGADGPVTAAVLTLVAEANRLLAGTTHGLYEIALTPLPATPLSPVPGMDPAAVVIALCTAGDALLVGTARHGLWIRPQPGQLLQQVLIDWS